MQIQKTERVFRYSGGLVLPDPDPSFGIEAVRQVCASSYPEIITAAVSGPELVDGKQVFTFKTAAGTKSRVVRLFPTRCDRHRNEKNVPRCSDY